MAAMLVKECITKLHGLRNYYNAEQGLQELEKSC
jgi:hypothetical protein